MRLSPWGRVVAISALLVVGGAVALAIGALASTQRAARRPTRSTGRSKGVAFDLGDGDIDGRRRRAARRRRGAALRALRVRAPAVRRAARRRRHVPRPLALPDDAARAVHRRLPRGRARQRRARHPHQRRARQPARLPRLGAGDDRQRRDRHRRLLRQLARRARRAAATSRVEAACAPPRLSLRSGSGSIRAVAAARPLRPRRREHVGQRERARPDAARRRAVHRAGAQRARATSRWRAGRDRGARARPAALARRARRRVPGR